LYTKLCVAKIFSTELQTTLGHHFASYLGLFRAEWSAVPAGALAAGEHDWCLGKCVMVHWACP